MKRKSIVLLCTVPAATIGVVAGTVVLVDCFGPYKKINIEEPKSKSATVDSDWGTITCNFKQEKTSHYKDTKVEIKDLMVHNKSEEPCEGLITVTPSEDGNIKIEFNTPLFIYKYLAKYYEVSANTNPIPSTMKFKIVNDKDRSEFTSSEYSITVTPALYKIACNSLSSQLTLPDEKEVQVYYPYEATYTITDNYRPCKVSILRYDGVELYGQEGVKFADGKIYIPWEYMTGPITITADAELYQANVYAVGRHVTYSGITSPIDLKTAISGTYEIESGYHLIQESSGVWVDGTKLTDGYSIGNGNITVDAEKVTGDVIIYVATEEDPSIFSVNYSGTHVTFPSTNPKTIDKATELNATYTLDSNYELDLSTTYVMVDGKKLESGFSIKDGNIKINAEQVTGNIVINVGAKEMASVTVTINTDAYVEFQQNPPKAYLNKQYKITYKLMYANLQSVEVKVGSNTLTRNTDYSFENGILTIFENKITDTVTITTSGTPYDLGTVTYDLDDRLVVESEASHRYYMQDWWCVLKAEFGWSTVTNYGCAVNGDESYTQYLEYDETTHKFTLPGKYVKGKIKIWVSLA